jgi:uncharacterized repeat protein (TIGR01451 family)
MSIEYYWQDTRQTWQRLVGCALALLFMVIGFSSPTFANQTATGATKTYPSGLTYTVGVTGARTVIFAASTPLNSIGGVTTAQLSPAILNTTDSHEIDVDPNGCVATVLRCANRGTLTITFNKPVTNPVLHISGLGANIGGTLLFHTSLVMTSYTAPVAPTFTALSNNGNLTVSSTEIRSTTVNGNTSCTTATKASCGSVRINGTVTSITFQVDLLMGGTGTGTSANVDGWNFTISVDEDFGDAPAGFDPTAAASHVVGGLYMGSGITVENAATNNPGTIAPSPIASATASTDADDGVAMPSFARGQTALVPVVVTGTGGKLQGWIDWAGDGNFATAGDRIATDVVDGGVGDTDGIVNGTIRLSVSVPIGATLTQTFARFRLSSNTGLGSTGLAPDGEVEDYVLTIMATTLNVTKISSVIADGVNTSNFKMIPGATVRYCLFVTNAGPATATTISMADGLPPTITYIPGTMVSATSCAGATTAEDDNAIGADESDPFGASISGTTITATTGTLLSSGGFAILFNAVIN